MKELQEGQVLIGPSFSEPVRLRRTKEEMEEHERERLEAMLEAVSLARNARQVTEEVEELRSLAAQACSVEASGAEAKLSKLKTVLQEQGFFDDPEMRLLIFTEFIANLLTSLCNEQERQIVVTTHSPLKRQGGR